MAERARPSLKLPTTADAKATHRKCHSLNLFDEMREAVRASVHGDGGDANRDPSPTVAGGPTESAPRTPDRPTRGGTAREASGDLVSNFACAGIIPFDKDGFWLCKQSVNGKKVWADFGGKREGGESAWETARREAREEGGVELERYTHGPIYHPESRSQAVLFLAEVTKEPRATERKVIEVRRFTQLPDELHSRLQYDRGGLIRKALRGLRFRPPADTTANPQRTQEPGSEQPRADTTAIPQETRVSRSDQPPAINPQEMRESRSGHSGTYQVPEVTRHPVLTLREDVDQRAAYYLHSLTLDTFKASNSARTRKCTGRRESIEDQYSRMRAYIASILGKENITRAYRYAEGKDVGRLFSNGLQNLKKEVRGLLCKGCTDIDMKNAHPTILLWVCDTEGIAATHLRRFVGNPQQYRTEIARCMDIGVSEAKTVLLAMMNDNNIFDPFDTYGFPRWITALDAEFKAIQLTVAALEKYTHLRRHAKTEKVCTQIDGGSYIKRNFEGSLMNLVLCEWENRMLNTAHEYLHTIGVETQLLSFDGLMVYGSHYGNTQLLTDLATLMRQTFGIELRFDFKEHDTTFSVPNEFQVYPVAEAMYITNIAPRFLQDGQDLARIVAGLRGQYEQTGDGTKATYRVAAESLVVRSNRRLTTFNALWDSHEVGLDADVLKYYSRESAEWAHIRSVREELRISTKTNFRETELRDYFLCCWGDNVLTLEKDKTFYVWWRGKWNVDDGSIMAHVMIEMMNKLFANIIEHWSRKLKGAMDAHVGDEGAGGLEDRVAEIKGKLEQISKTSLAYGNTKNTNVKKLVFDQLRAQCKITDPFDRKLHYFAFTNAVYDLERKRFFVPSKFDFILTTCGKPWVPPTKEEYDKVRALYESVFPDDEMRRGYVSVHKSGLSGVRPEKFIIATGGGRNGKGMLNENAMSVMGNYAVWAHIACLTRPIKDGANQELRGLHRKRFVLYSEPEDGLAEKLRLSNIKQLTGCDTVNARGLYEKETDTELHGTQLMECNKLPAITGDKGEAATERVRMFPFTVTFTDDPGKLAQDPEHFKPIDVSLKTPEFKEQHRCAFFKYIVDWGGDDVYFPRRTKDLGTQYLQENDDLSLWFLDRYERCENQPPEHFVSIKDMFSEFQTSAFYTEMSRAEKRRVTQTQFLQDIEKNIVLKHFFRSTDKVRVKAPNGRLKYNKRAGVVHYRRKAHEDDNMDDFGDARVSELCSNQEA